MIKVALISHSPHFCGAEKMLFSLAASLQNSDNYHPVMFIPDSPEAHPLKDICKEHQIESTSMPHPPLYIHQNRENEAEQAANTLKQASALARQFRQQEIAIVVCNTLVTTVPSLAANIAEIPSIVWIHGILDGFYIGDFFPLHRRLIHDRLNLALCNHVVCCSKWTEDYYRPMSVAPICTITNWSDIPEKTTVFDKKNRTFVCLNTFDPNKGVNTLLEACHILKGKKLDFTLELYGTGSEEAALRKYVDDHDLKEEVRFCGKTNQVDEVYQNCRCLIQPSFIESFGLTITEAMSHGRPVIAVNQAGPKQIVDNGVTGFLVPPKDAKALAEKMALLLEDSNLCEEMGRAAQKRFAELFSPKQTDCFLKLFDKVYTEGYISNPQKRLLLDSYWDSLQNTAQSMVCSSQQVRPEHHRLWIPEQLVPSGKLKDGRTYRVTCTSSYVTKLGFLFAIFDKPTGFCKVTVKKGNAIISTASFDLEGVIKDNYSFVLLSQPIQNCYLEDIDISFAFYNLGQGGHVELFEHKSRRTFLYRLFKKLGLPLRGRNALFLDFS